MSTWEPVRWPMSPSTKPFVTVSDAVSSTIFAWPSVQVESNTLLSDHSTAVYLTTTWSPAVTFSPVPACSTLTVSAEGASSLGIVIPGAPFGAVTTEGIPACGICAAPFALPWKESRTSMTKTKASVDPEPPWPAPAAVVAMATREPTVEHSRPTVTDGVWESPSVTIVPGPV